MEASAIVHEPKMASSGEHCTPPLEEACGRLGRLARRLFDVPAACVIRADGGGGVLLHGPPLLQEPDAWELSRHVPGSTAPFVVEDLLADTRFTEKAQASKKLGLRFVAGTALNATAAGYMPAFLFILDVRPRRLGREEQALLLDLADLGGKAWGTLAAAPRVEGQGASASPACGQNWQETQQTPPDGGAPSVCRDAMERHPEPILIHTERKQTEAAMEQLTAELEQRMRERTAELEAANQELEAFAYSVSHDLRAPLRAIHGFSRILIDDYLTELSPKAGHYLSKIKDNALSMGVLLDDLLRFSRLSRHALERQAVDPATLARQALEELEPMQRDRSVDVTVGALPPCKADPRLLKQVFVNLLSNALKFSAHCEAARIEVGASDHGGTVIYYVADNGVGFDVRYADKLFGVFQRLHHADEYEGTGVGLAIVQRIVHRHGGVVWAVAEPGRGATFFFTLEHPALHDA